MIFLRYFTVVAIGVMVSVTAAAAADEKTGENIVVAKIDLSAQTMTVYFKGRLSYKWPVSTARRGKVTPTGNYTAQWLSKYHKSSLYDGAPMPYSIFFHGNFAVHGTNQISRLGQPASAGCVRLHPDNAAILFEMARKEGLDNTKVVIVE